MRKENLKQKILLGLSAFFILVGVVNLKYFGNKAVEVSAYATENMGNEIEYNIGDVQLVNSDAVIENKIDDNSFLIENNITNECALVQNDVEEKLLENEDNIVYDEKNDDYFVKTKLERDLMYSEMIETYEKILENDKISSDQKGIASEEITNITNTKNGIMISENLLKNKGFEDVVILVNNEKASVVVDKLLLSTEDIAKIQNIVCNNLKVDIKNITISSYK